MPKIVHIYQWRYIYIGNNVHLSTSTVRKLTVCKGKVCLHASAAVHVTTTCSFACQRFRIPNQTIHWAERSQGSSDTFIGLHPPDEVYYNNISCVQWFYMLSANVRLQQIHLVLKDAFRSLFLRGRRNTRIWPPWHKALKIFRKVPSTSPSHKMVQLPNYT